MGRFDYLKQDKKAKKAKKKNDDNTEMEDVAVVYVRRETVRAVWKELKDDGESAESISELVDDLLLEWLNVRS